MPWPLALIAGLLFGAGLAISGMINPAKVANFLDVAGQWDATLAFVMAGALATTAVGYALLFRRPAPLFAAQFSLPPRHGIDARLLAGAATFGVGWGLAGICPGPALAGLGSGRVEAGAFVIAMIAGMMAARWALTPLLTADARTTGEPTPPLPGMERFDDIQA